MQQMADAGTCRMEVARAPALAGALRHGSNFLMPFLNQVLAAYSEITYYSCIHHSDSESVFAE